eukprot:COSAG06_NODE_48553_length_331_cov_0.823276_1_plen_80_part_10
MELDNDETDSDEELDQSIGPLTQRARAAGRPPPRRSMSAPLRAASRTTSSSDHGVSWPTPPLRPTVSGGNVEPGSGSGAA